MKKILLSILVFSIVLEMKSQITESPNGNVGIGTTFTDYAILTINGDNYNTLRLENDVPNKETSIRFRSKSSSGGILHSDISLYSTGNNQGYLGFKVPHNNTVNSGYDMIINHSGNVGIGMTTPTEKLDVQGLIKIGRANNQDNNSPGITAASNDDFSYDGEYINQYGFGFHGFQDGTTNFTNPLNTYVSGHFGIDFFTASGNKMRISRNGNVGIGTIKPDMKLTVKGNIHAEEVKIDLSVPAPDYVFKEDYNLRSIEEVEKFIKNNSHLPEIPSAKEFEENGIMQAEMDMNLLKKIEELTLYTIAQEKKLKTQDSKIEKIEKENEQLTILNKKLLELQSRLEKLESEKEKSL